MQKHPTHKSAKGFTLIELVIAVAVIGILTTIAILGYNQYKVRAYDAHSKQVLHNILLQCNAFWLEHDALKACEHPTEAEVYVAGDEIVIKFPSKDLPDLPGGSHGNFCASAQHVSSPNTYSIDSASLISDTEDCGGAGGSVQTASAPVSFATYNPMIAADECEMNQHPLKGQQGFGTFALVDADGAISVGCPGGVGEQSACLLYSTCDGLGGAIDRERDEGYIGLHTNKAEGRRCLEQRERGRCWQNWEFGERRMVFVAPGGGWTYAEGIRNNAAAPLGSDGQNSPLTIAPGAPCSLLGGWQRGRCSMSSSGMRGEAAERTAKLQYNFETGIWSNDRGEKFKNGELVE